MKGSDQERADCNYLTVRIFGLWVAIVAVGMGVHTLLRTYL